MLPIISIVGPSDSGKTTLAVKLVRALKRKGHRVGVLKHTHAAIKLDRAGTDTDRFRRAGAALSAISDDGLLASFCDISGTPPRTIFGMLTNGLDLLIVEGYKKELLPKLLFTDHLELVDFKGIAATYGKEGNRERGTGNSSIPHFKPSETGKIARWLERTFIAPGGRSGAVRVTVDGRDLPIKPFVARMVRETNRGLLKTLKGGRGRNVQIAIDFGRKI
ncbi:MAG: molybdopterin-guanine dinucleotide biosynthesis protein B [Candidatus Edwardsbacteria bacterium]|jgi:molybdopterin-guanine dinucleotide biosynthesis protein B|nr:molybdopterin-guanine dinucleotide biosynthesis protein B [Candidatus Edwardsbacteria bacterium]